MTPRLKRVLLAHKAASPHKAPHAFVFSTESGRPQSYTNAKRELNRIGGNVTTQAGGKRLGLHSFRHSYATRMILAGADAQTVARLLGHLNVNMVLNRYAQVFEARQAAGSLSALVASALA